MSRYSVYNKMAGKNISPLKLSAALVLFYLFVIITMAGVISWQISKESQEKPKTELTMKNSLN